MIKHDSENTRFKTRRLTELGEIVKEAERVLLGGRGGFASDVLKVEVVRPGQQPLTLIDTPGLIQSHNEGREYIDLVRRIVDDWILQRGRGGKSGSSEAVGSDNCKGG